MKTKNKMLKKAISLVTAAVMALGMLSSGAFAAESADAPMSTLQNTLYKLSAEKSLTVGYIGGSITAGSNASDVNTESYRALTTKWFKDSFPEAEIKEITAGIGGTGTKYGLYRADSDLKLGTEEEPDLTFIEFAINDKYDRLSESEASFYYESLINKLYGENPNMDIVCLITTDWWQRENDFTSREIQKQLAKHYGIPVVDMGEMLNGEMRTENGGAALEGDYTSNEIWQKYFSDVVHPNNAGHAKYAGYITDYLGTVLTGNAPEALAAKQLPEAINANLASDAYIATFNDMGYTKYGNGWEIDNEANTVYAAGANQTFGFSFTGTRLEIFTNAKSNDFGHIKYNIDGTEYIKSLVHGGDCRIVELASGLENKEHSVVLVTTDDSVPADKKLIMSGVCIAGDSAKAGIKADGSLSGEENDIPAVTINVPESAEENEAVTVTATATDNQGTVSGIFYVNGAVYTGEVTVSGGTYTAVITDLPKGNNTVEFKAVDKYGAVGTASAVINVKLPERATGIISYKEVSNPDFINNKDKYGGRDGKDIHNFILCSGSGSIAADEIMAPVFLKYDISSLVDPDGDGVIDYGVDKAYLLAQAKGNGNTYNGMPIQIYDIPSNNISLDSFRKDGKLVPPEIGNMYTSSNNNTGHENFVNEGFVFEEMPSIDAAHDITDYVNTKLTSETTSFSMMIYSSWGYSTQYIGAGEKAKQPRIYLSLVKKPQAEIDRNYSYDAAGNLMINIKASYKGGIEKVDLYADGTLAGTSSTAANGVYTVNAGTLAEGKHTFRAVVTGTDKVSGATSAVLNVKKLYEIVDYTGRVRINKDNNGIDEFISEPGANDGNVFNYARDDGYRGIVYNFGFAGIAAKAKTADNIKKIYFVAKGQVWNNAPVWFDHMSYTDISETDFDTVNKLTKINSFGDGFTAMGRDTDMSAYSGINAKYNTEYYSSYFVLDVTDYIKGLITDEDGSLKTNIPDMIFKLLSRSYLSKYPLYMLVEYNDIPEPEYDAEDTIIVANKAIGGNVSESGAKVNASYEVSNNTGSTIDATLFVGYYKNGKLVEATMQQTNIAHTGTEITQTVAADITVPQLDDYGNVSVCAYLWKTGTYKPLTEAIK